MDTTAPTPASLKESGNAHFREGRVSEAIAEYSKALVLLQSSPAADASEGTDTGTDASSDAPSAATVVLSNRAAAFLKCDEFVRARQDCDAALVSLTPVAGVAGGAERSARTDLMAKVWYRRGLALRGLGLLGDAMGSFEQAAECPCDDGMAKKVAKETKQTRARLDEAARQRVVDGAKPRLSDFEHGRQLGEGNFSRVMHVTHRVSRETYALKVIEKKKVQRLKVRHRNITNEIMMEKAVLNRLRHHHNIIFLHNTFQDGDGLYFLMEYDETFTELWDVMSKGKRLVGLSETQTQFFAAQMINGLEHLHKHGVVHRDLKPENMLVSSSGCLKIVDFGTAKDLQVRAARTAPHRPPPHPLPRSPATAAVGSCLSVRVDSIFPLPQHI